MPRSDNDSEGEGNSSEEYVSVDRDQIMMSSKMRNVSTSSWMQRKVAYHTPPSVPTSVLNPKPSYETNYSQKEMPGGPKAGQRSSGYGANGLSEVPQERGRLNTPFANLVGRRRASSPNRQ